MKKLRVHILVIVLGILGILGLPLMVQADSSVGYSIRAILPENQLSQEHSYFDLRMTPDQEQTIQVEVRNESNEETTFDVSVNQAYTNGNGFIDYADSEVKPDASLKYKINDLVSYPKELTVPAGEAKMLDLAIKMPAETFDGEILAGIQVKKDPQRDEAQEGQISNLYGYILGLRLTETDQAVARDVKLTKTRGDVAFGKAAVIATIQNPTMDAIGKLDYQGKVYEKDQPDQLIKEFSYKGKEMSLAPNSNYDFAIDLGKKSVEAGEYTLELMISDAKGNQWSFKKDFTITTKQAKQINAIVLPDSGNPQLPGWLYIVGGIFFAILLLLTALLLKKRKQQVQLQP